MLRKKMKKSILAVLGMCMVLAQGSVYLAADGGNSGISVASTTDSVSGTAKDSHGNKYTITGTSVVSGKIATSQTSFIVSLYAGGGDEQDKKTVNGYSKTLTTTGDVSFLNGAKDTYTSSKVIKAEQGDKEDQGSQGYLTADGGPYSYSFFSVKSTHKFSCEGANLSITSTASWI